MNLRGILDIFDGDDDEDEGDAPDAGLPGIERKVDAILNALNVEYLAQEFTPALSPQVQYYVDRGQKIQAIKAYRDETGAGLREAKDAVEGNGGALTGLQRVSRKLDILMNALGIAKEEPEEYDEDEPELSLNNAEIAGLVRSGRMIEAIRQYRLATGVGLKEAKDAVDAMAREMRSR